MSSEKKKRKRNPFFSFRQFTVYQDKCAMKVTTECCIAGAYCPIPKHTKRILDIGTGTGLMPLMLAQRTDDTNIPIDSVEIEKDAFLQATENIKKTKWSQRISLFHLPIQEYSKKEIVYDLIISNPPYYGNEYKRSDDNKWNMAIHAVTLTPKELCECVVRLLDKQGSFVVLYPEKEMKIFELEANAKGLFAVRRLFIRHNVKKNVLRVISVFRFQKADKVVEETLVMRELDESYTPEFKQLMKDFYTDSILNTKKVENKSNC